MEDQPQSESLELDSTIQVFHRAQQGDVKARRVLIGRSIGPITRWARRRLPNYARASANTDDIVMDVMLRALNGLAAFEYRTLGALLGYLRTAVINRIRDEIRRTQRRGSHEDVDEFVADRHRSALEELILKESTDRYLDALRRLRPDERLLMIFRLEHQQDFAEIARRVGKSTPDAARVAFKRALDKLAGHLGIKAPTVKG